MKKYLMCLAAAAFAIAACGEKEPQKTETPEISVNPAEISVESAGGTATLQITSNTKWAISTTDAWISFEPASGEGNASVTVTAAENTAYKEREGKLSINSTAKRLTVNVKQAATEKPAATKLTEIKTAEEFFSFIGAMDQYEAGETVKLTADITISEPANELNCIFDGQGHTITLNYEIADALTADAAELANIGVFRKITATVKNLKTAGSIKAQQDGLDATFHIGGIAGYVSETATIENCTNGIAITATNFNTHHLGGIAGYTEAGASITGCKNTAAVTAAYEGSSKASQLGGIIGHIEGAGTVTSCINEGAITYTGGGTARMGGICGYVNNVTQVLFKDCTNSGEISTTATGYTEKSWAYVGGISGYYGTPTRGAHATYEGCVNNGAVTCDAAGTKLRARVAGINCHAGNSNDKANGDGTGIYTWELKSCTNNGAISLKNCVAATRSQLGGIQAYGEPSGQVVITGCTSNGKLYSENPNTDGKYNAIGCLLGGNAALNSTFTDNTVTANATITSTLPASESGPHCGLICGTNNPYTTAVTGKVGSVNIVKGDAITTTSADNFASLLFGQPLGAGATISGVTFGN